MVWVERPKREPKQHALPQRKRRYRPDLKATLNGNVPSSVDTVDYLGLTFARNTKLTNHVEGIFRKWVRLSFFARKLRRLSTPTEFILKFAEACVIPITLAVHQLSSLGFLIKILPFLGHHLSSPVKYPWLTQLITSGIHLRETQSGPIMLRESLESVCVYRFVRNTYNPLLFTNHFPWAS